MGFEFCWEHRACTAACPVRESESIFCWRIAQRDRRCHPDTCASCPYQRAWFAGCYDLQEFIALRDAARGRRKPRGRVLVVDDEPYFRFALEETVRELGCNCLTAVDGEEGLFFARQTLPDLIVTDVQMPRSSGFDLCRALKADPRTAGIPVIITSALVSQAEIDRGLAEGAVAYLVKPLSPTMLENLMRSLLPPLPEDRSSGGDPA